MQAPEFARNSMSLISTLSYVSAVSAFALAIFILFAEANSVANTAYCAGMILLGLEAWFNAWFVLEHDPLLAARWGYFGQLALALLPGIWLVFSLSYARGNFRDFLARWRWFISAGFALPLLLSIAMRNQVVLGVNLAPNGSWFLHIGASGYLINILFIISAVLILVNLESTLRTSVGVMRWRIKFMVIGLGLLLILRIYTSSQILLRRGEADFLVGMNACALLVACLLMAGSLARRSLMKIDVYPSQTVLFNSLIIFFAGLYLLVAGFFAKIAAPFLGGEQIYHFQPFLMLLGGAALAILLLSERIRQQVKRLISRHFQRPFYDYRKIWMTFTASTSSLMEKSHFCRAAVRWISDTFQLLSVTVWTYDVQNSCLAYSASTSLTEAKTKELLGDNFPWEKLIQFLKHQTQPVDIEASTEDWALALKRLTPSVFPDKGGNRVCVPLIAREQLLGLIMLGDRVSGMPFSIEDMDLLKCIGDQMAGGLLNNDLSHKLMQAKEMEAFQTMSAFFVHDLKNTASTLSLMLQNMQMHFDDPEFREDARRAVSKSVSHINDLIERLSVLRQGLVVQPVPAALHEVVATALRHLQFPPEVTLIDEVSPVTKTMLDPEQIQKIVANLILNAMDAVNRKGEIRVATFQEADWVVLRVSDNGCGMSPDFVSKSLFKPFQTMKKKGIGIGMYHSKMIVEAHHGKIAVESQPGKGTTFRVLLPVSGAV
jgi:putative PEP-CTERM system histidine kinase